MQKLVEILKQRKDLIKIIDKEVDTYFQTNKCNIQDDINKILNAIRKDKESKKFQNRVRQSKKNINRINNIFLKKMLIKRSKYEIENGSGKNDLNFDIEKIYQPIVEYVFGRIYESKITLKKYEISVKSENFILEVSQTFKADEIRNLNVLLDKSREVSNLLGTIEKDMSKLIVKINTSKKHNGDSKETILARLECGSLSNKIIELIHMIDLIVDLCGDNEEKILEVKTLDISNRFLRFAEIGKIGLNKANILTERQITEEKKLIQKLKVIFRIFIKEREAELRKIIKVKMSLIENSKFNDETIRKKIIEKFQEKLGIFQYISIQ